MERREFSSHLKNISWKLQRNFVLFKMISRNFCKNLFHKVYREYNFHTDVMNLSFFRWYAKSWPKNRLRTWKFGKYRSSNVEMSRNGPFTNSCFRLVSICGPCTKSWMGLCIRFLSNRIKFPWNWRNSIKCPKWNSNLPNTLPKTYLRIIPCPNSNYP